MTAQSADAIWNGGLKDGKGNISTGSGALNSAYSFKTRFEGDQLGTTPEELIGAAHAGCFSMYLSSLLEKAGHPPKHIRTQAEVELNLEGAVPVIQKITLVTEGDVPEINAIDFLRYAQQAKEECPVSAALKAVPDIKLKANLK